ncbi:MAG: putative nucleic acid-binding Zn ribbon protein [Luteibaculaceae bacterium]|jgi:predicted  nucleic acid-binding Zn ribbon protein
MSRIELLESYLAPNVGSLIGKLNESEIEVILTHIEKAAVIFGDGNVFVKEVNPNFEGQRILEFQISGKVSFIKT